MCIGHQAIEYFPVQIFSAYVPKLPIMLSDFPIMLCSLAITCMYVYTQILNENGKNWSITEGLTRMSIFTHTCSLRCDL